MITQKNDRNDLCVGRKGQAVSVAVIKGLVNDPEDEETLLNLRVIVLMNVEMTLAELEMTTLLRAAIAVIVMEMDLTVIAEGEVEDLKGIEG